MPAMLTQKPSKNSKSKDHLVSPERRFILWEERDISNWLHEGETIQQRMKISEKGKNIEKIYLKFKNTMSKSNVSGALKLLTENILNGILPFNDKALKMLKQKHPETNELPQELLFQGPTRSAHPIVYEDMDEPSFWKQQSYKKGFWTIWSWRWWLEKNPNITFIWNSIIRLAQDICLLQDCLEGIKNAESLESDSLHADWSH